jgi:hypothetical protein
MWYLFHYAKGQLYFYFTKFSLPLPLANEGNAHEYGSVLIHFGLCKGSTLPDLK